MAEETYDVDHPSEWIEEDEKAHALARDLREGVPAMRKAAERFDYMWPNPGEMETVTLGGGPPSVPGQTKTLYELRIARSDLPNPWAETICSTARLPFRSRIVLAGWDDELMGRVDTDSNGQVVHREPGWVDTLTTAGQGLDEYGAETFEDALFEGVAYSFVDNDPRKFASPADRRRAGAQPRVTKFRRCHVRRLTMESRNGVPRLKQAVLVQPIEELDITDPNAWHEECRDARKVVTAGDPDALPLFLETGERNPLRTVRTQVYLRDGEDGPWYEDVSRRGQIIPENPVDELLDIPLVPHLTQRTGPYRGRSPFLNTAWTQAVIWNHNSEIGNLAREASLTHVHETGVPVDAVTKRPILADTRGARYHWSNLPDATFSLHEMKGTSLQSIRELIEWKIATIEKAHHQIQVASTNGPVTAREITLEGVHASSALEMWVIFQELAWKRILDLVALLGGLPKRGVVSIPHDFGLPNTGMERNHALFLAGEMSPEAYWRTAKRFGDVDDSFNVQEEVAWHDAKAAAVNGGGGGT